MGDFSLKADLPKNDIRAKYESGMTVSALAKAYGVGFGTMQRHLKESGACMRKNSWNRFDSLLPGWVEDYLNKKLSLKQIAASSGVDYATVRRYLLESGVALRADSSVQTYQHVSPCAGEICVRGTWELAYAKILDAWIAAGLIRSWSYESCRISTSGKVGSWYEPDFKVVAIDGSIVFHEVKGYLRTRAMAKIAAARSCGNRVVLITGKILSALCSHYGLKVKF